MVIIVAEDSKSFQRSSYVMLKKKIETIEEYILASPEEVQDKLCKMRACIQDAAPEAHENIKWGRPAYSDDERILVMFAAFKKHIGFYSTPSTIQAFHEEIAPYKTGRGSIQFPLNGQLPTELIRNITAFRVRESKEEGVKRKS